MSKNKTRSIQPNFTEIVRNDGEGIVYIRHFPETDEVFYSEDGEDFRRADVWLRERITGISGRDAGEVNPVFPAAALRGPTLRLIHEAKLKDMILYAADYYRPDLARKTPNLSMLAEAMVTVISRFQEMLTARPTVHDRWDMITGTMIEWLINPPKLVPAGSRK